MSQCTVTLRDGTKCKGEAGEGRYCGIHRNRFRKQVKHGRYALPEVLGVPEKYHAHYEHFLAQKKPFDLSRELALMRTLFIELRDTIESKNSHRAERIVNDFTGYLNVQLKGDEEKVAALIRMLQQGLLGVLQEHLDETWVSSEDSESLMDAVEKISRVAERMKKIQEGVKLEIKIDQNVLVKFLYGVVFKVCTDPTQQQRIMQMTSQMSLSQPTPESEMLGLPEFARDEVLEQVEEAESVAR